MGQVIFLTPSCPLGPLKIQNFFLFFFFRPLNSISPLFPANGDLFRHFPSFLDLFWNLKKNFFWKIFLGFFSKNFFFFKNSIFLAKFQFFLLFAPIFGFAGKSLKFSNFCNFLAISLQNYRSFDEREEEIIPKIAQNSKFLNF